MNIISKYKQRKVKNAVRKDAPYCCVCGRFPKWYQRKNEVHRVLPEHLFPELAADRNNMAVMCRHDHKWIGHPDGWKTYNKNFWQTVRDVVRAYINTKVTK